MGTASIATLTPRQRLAMNKHAAKKDRFKRTRSGYLTGLCERCGQVWQEHDGAQLWADNNGRGALYCKRLENPTT